MKHSNNSPYRDSHATPGKGSAYDKNFELRYRAYLWSQEKQILSDIAATFLADNEINYLDFACGTGRIISHLAPIAKTATGVDLSDAMLTEAREKPGDLLS